jgi:hypothetical protein
MSTSATSPAGMPAAAQYVTEMINAAITAALDGIGSVPKTMTAEIDACLGSLMRPVPEPPTPQPELGLQPMASVRDASLAAAENAYESSEHSAEAMYRTAKSAWNLALAIYNSTVANAASTLENTVQTGIAATKFTHDSNSRDLYLYYNLRNEMATALQTYYGSVEGAQSTLVSAAGTLITAVVSFATGIAAAEATKQVANSIAWATFWQSVAGDLV